MESQASIDRTSPEAQTIVLSWVKYHGRSAGIAKGLRGTALFPPDEIMNLKVPSRYVQLAKWTNTTLKETSAKLIIVMMPPSFLVFAVKLWTPRTTRVVGDLHSAALRGARWGWLRGLAFWSLRRDGAIVTNQEDARLLALHRVNSVILHDDISIARIELKHKKSAIRTVVFPASYAPDEPIPAILDACRLLPDIRFVFTGKAPNALRDNLPANTTVTGFLAYEDLIELLSTADSILAITTRNFTMQRAGYEAFSLGVPQVTSNFPVLREFYEDTASYCNPTEPESIRDAIMDSLARTTTIKADIEHLRGRRISEQRATYDAILAKA
ncbi:glycosyltransferase [Naasia lichenicola]|uniref:Glycosyltransferase n=1 Tax=Naasia lichenicola TaxID=2565933 RepID=A0A4S4FP28_9MICO|nr:glycosyltransferase [Naasia lichenicola]THG30771.1 glycosyltransferase [Naasia lichenicola]THG32008.1 glycosyltransferase [Naasia lichenicola]